MSTSTSSNSNRSCQSKTYISNMLGIISPKRTMCAHGLSMHLKSARRLNQKEGVSTSTSCNSNRSWQSKTYISKMLGIISPKRTMRAHGLSMQLKLARRLNQKEGVSTSTSSNSNRSCQSKTYISDILGIISPKATMRAHGLSTVTNSTPLASRVMPMYSVP